ncbi:hypothetical protein K502DRAFT_305356 [Neoconidiobolus thromboides FSU 785]|nr:hypothetical protein K502DRAFT_305356 [Neoconidiobolus thromboides FSU 785]
MKLKRLKNNQKVAKTYQTFFNFREPYQILVEGELLQHTLKLRLNLKEVLCKVLDGPVKLMISPCTIQELRDKGDEYLGAVVAAKRFTRRNCMHKKAISSIECITSILGDCNQHRLFLASHDKILNKKILTIPAVPHVYFVNETLLISPLSLATQKKVLEIQNQKYLPSEKEIQILDKLKGEQEEEEKPIVINKKKKAKGPNPLSIKRRKLEDNNKQTQSKGKDKDKDENKNNNIKKEDDLNVNKEEKTLFNKGSSEAKDLYEINHTEKDKEIDNFNQTKIKRKRVRKHKKKEKENSINEQSKLELNNEKRENESK